jgi:hypothetical protein
LKKKKIYVTVTIFSHFWSERAKEKVEIRARDRMEVKEG